MEVPEMVLTRSQAVCLFNDVRLYTAQEWPDERLEQFLNDPTGWRMFDRPVSPSESFADALAAIGNGKILRVVPDPEPLQAPPAHEKKAPPPKRLDRNKSTYAERRQQWAVRAVKMGKKKGVMYYAVQELRAAKKENRFVSHLEILEVLKIRFPDRRPEGMYVNLHNLIPGRMLEHYGVTLEKGSASSGRVGYRLANETDLLN